MSQPDQTRPRQVPPAAPGEDGSSTIAQKHATTVPGSRPPADQAEGRLPSDHLEGTVGPLPVGPRQGDEEPLVPEPGATLPRPTPDPAPGETEQTVIRQSAAAETANPGPHEQTVTGAASGAPRPFHHGEHVPGYEILGELGRGGMGVVHRALDVRLNRMVALKMVLSGSDVGDEDRKRFLAEARTVAQLQHPNIVQVFEVGEANGVPFCALEYVAGGTLAGALKGVPQEPRGAADRAQVLARAMVAVHAAGLIHRDLKPANVLIGVEGTLKITDFGLAKRLDDPTGRTQAGQVLGTPSYMAPEQAVGDVEKVGARSDIWALGAILYEMLTGRPPFRGTGIWDTIALVLEADPVPVRRLQPGCPRDLETVCLKCLEKDPNRRYQSSAELADDLQRYLDGRDVLARRAGPFERAAKWARRSPLRAALAGAAVTCAGLLAALLVLKAQTAEQEAKSAEQVANLARRDNELTKKQLYDSQRREAVRDRFAELLTGAEKEAATAADAAAWNRIARTLRAALELAKADPEAFDGWSLQTAAEDLLARADTALTAAQRRDAERKRFAALGEHHSDAVFHATLATGLGLQDSTERVRHAVADGLALYSLTVDGNGPPAVVPGVLTPDELKTLAYRCYELLLLDAEVLARPIPGETVATLRARVGEALARLDRAAGVLPGVPIRSGLTRRAEYLTALGRNDEATAAAALAEATAPTLALDYYLIGLEHYRQEEFAKAVPVLGGALQADPAHFGAQYLLAVCQYRQPRSQPEAAKVGLTRCLNQRPGFVWPRLLRASVEMELARRGSGDFSAARADLDFVLKNPPDAAAKYAALTNRGVLEIYRRDWDAAVADLTDAIRIQPDGAYAYINLSLAHRRRADAASWRSDVLAAGPVPTAAASLAATRAAYRAHALDDAVAALDDAVKRRPNDHLLYHERGQVHLLRGDAERGRTDLTRAILLAPKTGRLSTVADDLLQLGGVLHEGKEYTAAARAYAAVLEIPTKQLDDTRRALAARQLSKPLLALGQWAEAADALDLYLSLTPVTEGRALAPEQARPIADALKARGLIHGSQQNLRAAVDSYTRSLGLVRDPEVLTLRGWLYLATGAAGLAEEDFAEILKLNPENAEALIGRANARVKLGRLRDAVADAEQGVRFITDALPAKTRHRLRYNAARVFAESVSRDPTPGPAVARTAEQLRAALIDLPPGERAAFWKDAVLTDPILARLSGSPAVQAVASEAGIRK